MLSTTGFEFGDVVLVAFPFTDQVRSKKRPAVIVNSTGYARARPDVILMAITSRLRQPVDFGEVPIQDWGSAGLLRASAIKPVVFTTEQTLLSRRLGKLSTSDQQAVRDLITAIFG